jgi:hypothetical protein
MTSHISALHRRGQNGLTDKKQLLSLVKAVFLAPGASYPNPQEIIRVILFIHWIMTRKNNGCKI